MTREDLERFAAALPEAATLVDDRISELMLSNPDAFGKVRL